jgi:diadenosine tetraphosphate (Ap4A) HIT family hydrolase
VGTEGTTWDDAAEWEALKARESCPICARGAPLDVIAELAATWVTAPREAPLPGYACVVSKTHVVEPFELPESERTAFWNEAMLVARAVCELVEPTKMNYEIHGNTIPHLHMHLFPRFRGDPYGGGPIDPRRESFTRSAPDLARLRDAVAAAVRIGDG